MPSTCASGTFYDGRLFGCVSQGLNTVSTSDSTEITCSPTSKYFKLGQICALDSTATAATSANSIYSVQTDLTKFVFSACSANTNVVDNQFCFPSLNTCTSNCIYLPSIFQTINNAAINGFSLSSIYTFMTSSTSTASFGYVTGSAPQASASPTAATQSSVEQAIISAYACYNNGSNQDPKSCNYLINRCLKRGFTSVNDDCLLLTKISYSDNLTLYQKITTQYTSNGINPGLYIMIYDESGEFIDFRPFTTDLQLCPKGVNDDNAFKTFGSSFDNSCKLDPTTIKSTSYFFELYTIDSSSTSTNKFSKILASVTYNDLWGQTSSLDVTRFYLYEKGFYSSQIQVATTIKLVIDASSSAAQLSINYNLISSTSSNPVKVTFQVSYQSNSMSTFWVIIEVVFAIYMVLVFLWSMVRFYIWTKYNPRSDGQRRVMPNYGQKVVFHAFIILCDCFGEALMFFLFVLSGALFIIAKGSSSPSFVLPPRISDSSPYTSFIVCCAFGFSFKLIATFYLIWKQSNCQIYFLDWEPKKRFQHQEEDKGQSSWRTLFVANEFNELAVYRIVSIEWTLFFMAMLMTGVDWQNGASNTFSSSSNLPTNNIGVNVVYKFFINAGLFFFIALIQIICRNLIKIWVPFKIQDFTDFCSVSNISIFIFDDYLHGYYLHGQSPDKYAEGNSLWLMQCLGEDVPVQLFSGFNFNSNNFGGGGYNPNQFNNSVLMRQLQQNTGGQMGGYQSARGGNQSMTMNRPPQMQQPGFNPNQGFQQDSRSFKTQKMKRNERGLGNTSDQQIFEFFLSWDLREQIDFMFDVRQKSIEYLEKKKKEMELVKKAQQSQKQQELVQKKLQQEQEIEEQKSLKQNEEEKKDFEHNQNYFTDLTLENGEELFKPKMDGILREVIRNMTANSGGSGNVFEMEFMQRFFLHLPPFNHVDRRFNQNMFYVDRDNIFSSVIYSGYEFTLVYFYIAVYVFIDLVSESTLIAVLVTYAVDYIFKYIRQEKGQENISTKAGIDEQFLI